MDTHKSVNLALRFLPELAALTSLGYGGWKLPHSLPATTDRRAERFASAALVLSRTGRTTAPCSCSCRLPRTAP